MELQVKKLSWNGKLPVKAYPTDLGYDLFADERTSLEPQSVTKVHTGIACDFPTGYGALLRDRSSMATKKEVFVVAGVIDPTYTGEIIVAFFNPNDFPIEINEGEKIAQMILIHGINFPVVEVSDLAATDRGDNGFGSTGS